MEVVSARCLRRKCISEPRHHPVYKKRCFVTWFNRTAPAGGEPLPALPRAGAHLYFESIHPFEDGNGRIDRAIAEKALARCVGHPTLIALAATILSRHKAYYAALEAANNGNQVTGWLCWFAGIVIEARRRTTARVEFPIEKTRLLDRHRGVLNPRQEKALLRMLREEPEGFKGALSAGNFLENAVPKLVRCQLLQRDRVHAVPQAARCRPVGEYVAEVRIAGITDGFYPLQEGRSVKTIRDYIGRQGLGERGPARPGLEFLRGVEQNGFAAEAGINTRLKQAAHPRTERPLGSRLAGHVIFLGAQLQTPFRVRLDDLAIRCGIAALGKIQHVGPFQGHDPSYRTPAQADCPIRASARTTILKRSGHGRRTKFTFTTPLVK